MITVNESLADGGLWNWVDEISVNGERFLSNLFLKVFTEGAVTEVGSLFQYFTTLTKKADPRLRRWPVGVLSKAATSGRKKSKFRSPSKRPINILNAVIRSTRNRRRCSLSS